MPKGKIVFFGTSEICLPFLERLKDSFDLPLIVTPPDAYGGRNRKQLIVPPVKSFAVEHHIPVAQPENLKEPGFKAQIRAIAPDLGVVIAYGKFIPSSIYKIPRHRMLNVHFSMLPLYRGAAPVQRGIANGDATTGISVFRLVKRMDAGPVWSQKEYPIEPEDTTASMWQRLSHQGAGFLVDTITGIFDGNIEPVPQDDEAATYAPPVQKEESKADWNLTARQLYDKARAFTPWPGLFCHFDDKRFKLTRIKVSERHHDNEPGDVLEMDKKTQMIKICCGQGSVLEILEIQPQGKKPMTPYCYCMGNQLPEKLS